MPTGTVIAPIVGSMIRTTCTFTTIDGVIGDPGSVTVMITKPDGTVDSYVYPTDITQVSTGVYSLEFMVDQAGVWEVEWIGAVSGPIVVNCLTFTARDC